MKLTPVLTEKGLADAKEGVYTFWVLPAATKYQIARAVATTFGVTVEDVRTANFKARAKTDLRRRKKKIKARKKALVKVKEGDKISLFETKG
jgi:large subunit ribosomal protein L23